MTDTTRWNAVLKRDRGADGRFVFAVRTTGIYCRPSCPARRPNRTNVTFYPVPEAARADGFRACRRCRPDETPSGDPATVLVRAAVRAIDQSPDISLTELARLTGRSGGHVQRTFRRVLGISPREYAETRTRGTLRDRLRADHSITSAQYGSGLSSSSRLYEKSSTWLGMTPGRYRNGGSGLTIRFGFGRSSLGQILVATTERGVCAVRIGNRRVDLEADVREEFSRARLVREDGAVDVALTRIIEAVDGGRAVEGLELDVQATAFQARVWKALISIPAGETRTYLDVARSIGQPTAVRAVASACAANPVALVVPCHRVIRTDGGMGGYRWGVERKEEILRREQG